MQNEASKQLAVYDSLLNGLAETAISPDASANSFFEKTIQVIETIVEPKWAAILANGPNDEALFVHGSADSKKQLDLIRQNSPADGANSDWIVAWTDPRIVVSEIEFQKLTWGWVAVGVTQEKTSSVQRELIRGVAEIVGEFVQTQERHSQSGQQSAVDDLLQFSVNAHTSLKPVEVAHQLANDARVLLGCERVSIFSVNRRRPKALAISSVATIEGRSELIQRMRAMVSLAVKNREPLFSDQSPVNDRQARLLDAHREKTGLPFVFGVPIYRHRAADVRSKPQALGFLIAESTDEIDRFRFSRAISFVAPHASVTMTNAANYNAIPFRRSLSAIGRSLNLASISKMTIVASVFGLALLAATLLKTDFKVRIQGELRPVVERNVFAPRDGIVESVFVGHGDHVVENEPLAQIRSPDLELEIEKSESDILKLEQLKDSRQIALNQISNTNPDPNLAAQLAAEISDIDFQIASLNDQVNFLRQQRGELKIVCPINGQVTTWQVNQRLINKPVRWGDPMVNVAQLDGQWNMVFRVPEQRIGYILDQQKSLNEGEKIELRFFLESNPGESFVVSVDEIGQSASGDSELGAVTLLKCDAPTELESRRLGASVAADVYCGKKSYWFVWTREIRDALRRRFVW